MKGGFYNKMYGFMEVILTNFHYIIVKIAKSYLDS